MELDHTYRIIDQKVAHEIIDGEVVVIHFETGSYYSLTGISAQLWQWLASRATRAQMLDALGPLTADQVRSVDDFIDSLVKEGIIEEAPGEPAAPLAKYGGPFEEPKFAKYNDMTNLLLSDPIHDVDETGWPNMDPNAP